MSGSRALWSDARGRNGQRGAVGKGCLFGGALLVALLVVGGLLVGSYNGLVGKKEKVSASWSEIDNQYKRRYDLIPQLVETVKGAANFEKSTLESVTEARASVGRAQLPAQVPTDPAQLQAYIAAQQGLGAALGRLIAVAEAYPDLKSSAAFRDLQSQLEGTENRIAVARRDYIDAVRDYDTALQRVPGRFVAGFGGMTPAAQLTMPEDERTVPKVDFGELK
jgi:LemA protein